MLEIEFCNKCDASLRAESQWCLACGTPVPLEPRPTTPPTPIAQTATVQAATELPGVGRSNLAWIGWVAFFVVLCGIPTSYLMLKSNDGGDSVPESKSESTEPAVGSTSTEDALDTPRPPFEHGPVDLDPVAPMARLHIESAAAATAIPGVDYLPALLRAMPETPSLSHDTIAEIGNAIWHRIAWPLDIEVTVFAGGTIAVALHTANREPFIMRLLLRAMVDSTGSSEDAEQAYTALPTTRVVGVEFLRLPLGSGSLYEGVGFGENHLVFLSPSRTSTRDILRRATVSRPQPSGEAATSWQRTAGGSIRAAIDIDEALQLVPEPRRAQANATLNLVVGQFRHASIRTDHAGEQYVMDSHLDLRTSGGLLGPVLTPGPEVGSLLGWVPTDTAEFFHLRFDPGALTRSLLALAGFGLMSNFGARENAAGTIGDTRLADLFDHSDGRFAYWTAAATADQIANLAPQQPGLFLFGTEDPAALRKDLTTWLLGDGGPSQLRHATDISQNTYALVAGETVPSLHFTDLPGALAVCDPASLALLRDCLATGGQAGVPKVVASKLGTAPADAVMIFASTMLGEMTRRVAKRDRTGKPDIGDEDLRRILQQVEADGGGASAGWVTLGADGMRGRVVY